MPIINNSNYNPTLILRNRHFNTIYPNIFRRVSGVNYHRLRIDTPDKDFLDLDFSKVGSESLVIVIHGLEGSADSTYVKGLVKACNQAHYDAVALNLRGCSGMPNRLYSSYHSGRTDDISTLLNYIQKRFDYKNICIVGFSLGGNITLKFAGEQGENIPAYIKAIVGVSVPCNLKSAAIHLKKASNKLYLNRLITSVKNKALIKKKLFPEVKVSERSIRKIKDFYEFDNLYTAPAHGFKSADDYWERCSSVSFIKSIKSPTLLINALDDPFIPDACYPFTEAQENPNFFLETPQFGGHVGFARSMKIGDVLWHEERIINFLSKYI